MSINLESIGTTQALLLILPGLISMHVYKLLMPVGQDKAPEKLLNAMFYGVLNLVICLPLLIISSYSGLFDYWIFSICMLVLVLLIFPILLPIIFVRFINSGALKGLQLPYPSAWDFVFNKRQPCFILIHLKNGKKIGGYYGSNSYSGSYPSHGEIYLEAVCKTDSDGSFSDYIEGTMGMLISQDAYDYIEMIKVPVNES